MNLLASTGPHINIKAEHLFNIGPISINNSVLLGILGYSIVIILFIITALSIKKGKQNFITKLITWGYETLYSSVEQIIGDRKIAKKIAPLPITLFFVILINYWIGIFPFVGPITLNGVPLFRGLMADMNTTFAFAIISMVSVQIYATKKLGLYSNLKRYFVNPFKNPIGSFVGILEVIAELSRLIALSLRLFGNVFAGEVLIVMIGFLTGYIASVALIPFMIFELFIGSVQAYVFFMLTTVFISLGMSEHESHEDHQPIEINDLKLADDTIK